MKTPRFTKCGFFGFWPLRAFVYCFWGVWRPCWSHQNEKTTFYKVWCFGFLAFKGLCVLFLGGLEAMLEPSSGIPRTQNEKTHFTTTVFLT